MDFERHYYGDFGIELNTLARYTGNGEEARIPDGVEMIYGRVFEHRTQLRKVVLPDSLDTIGTKTFFGCTALEDINLSEWADARAKKRKLCRVSRDTFWGCSRLADADGFIIRDGRFFAFLNQKATSIEVPAGVVEIVSGSFEYTRLDTVRLPDSVERIRPLAFYGSHILHIDIPNGVTAIEDYVFASCKELAKIRLPKGLKKIGDKAFDGAFSLRQIEIPDGVTELGERCFAECRLLERIVIPDTVKKIGKFAFAHCTSLKEVVLPAGLKTIEWSVFEGCTSLKEIVLPAGVETIETTAFANCTQLEKIVISSDTIQCSDDALDGSEKAHIVCSKQLMQRLPRKLRAVCKGETPTSQTFNYHMIDRLDTDRLIADVAPKFTWEKPIYPKNRVVKVDAGKFQAEITCKVAYPLRQFRKDLPGSQLYDMYETLTHTLPGVEDESRKEMYGERSYYPIVWEKEPEVSDDAVQLTPEQQQKRFTYLAYVAHMLDDDAVIAKIVEEMPRRKNGKFAKRYISHIATACLTTKRLPQVFEIIVKPTSDTAATVMPVFWKFNEEECAQIEVDFVMSHPEIFPLSDYLDEGPDEDA